MIIEFIQQAASQISEPSGFIDVARQFIEEKFGTAGIIAAALLLVSIVGLLLGKVTKLSFNLVRFVVIPSVAVTFIATYFLPYSFVYILPVTVAFFSVVLMVKG
ncbi:MAG: hypothetical protein DRP51_00160 [Candidatus Zixiibacteriota bacterium]|nr:MAG: hypothetical protein DRP51_00160 [candidate division Zixibacteria bacterium]